MLLSCNILNWHEKILQIENKIIKTEDFKVNINGIELNSIQFTRRQIAFKLITNDQIMNEKLLIIIITITFFSLLLKFFVFSLFSQ